MLTQQDGCDPTWNIDNVTLDTPPAGPLRPALRPTYVESARWLVLSHVSCQRGHRIVS